jgi:hypothetical protein
VNSASKLEIVLAFLSEGYVVSQSRIVHSKELLATSDSRGIVKVCLGSSLTVELILRKLCKISALKNLLPQLFLMLADDLLLPGSIVVLWHHHL